MNASEPNPTFSAFRCPACARPLRRFTDTDGILLYCMRETCKSTAAKDGCAADDEGSAFGRLKRKVELEENP